MSAWRSLRSWIDKKITLRIELADPVQVSKIRFLHTALILSLLTLLANQSMDFLAGRGYVTPIVLLVMDLPLVAALGLMYLKMYDGAKFLFLGGFSSGMMTGQLFISFIGTENYLFVILLIGFSVLDRRLSLVLLTLYCTLLFNLVKWGMSAGYLQQGDLPDYYQYVNSAMSVIVVALLAYRYSSLNDRQVYILETMNQDLQKKKALTENLMRELNHRVKNNLQIISSLFNLQAHTTVDQETKVALAEARNRINTIAILHQKLYQGDLLFDVDIQSYIQSLGEFLHLSDVSPQTMEIKLDIDPCTLSIQNTIYLGLVVNELVTNSMKYARQPDQDLLVEVDLHAEESKQGEAYLRVLDLSVRDNGPGISAQTLGRRKGFGLELVKTIVGHYDGTLTIDKTSSTGCEILATFYVNR